MRMISAAAMLLGGTAAVIVASQPSGLPTGSYTAAQAEQGEALYDDQCLSCHGAITAFVPEVAALLGDHTFRNRWTGRSVGELFELIQVEMPQDSPGSLSPEETAHLVAYILSGHRIPAGDTPLPHDPAQLTRKLFEP